MDKIFVSIRKEAFIIFIAALLLGIYLHWPAFVQPDRVHENWRQVPHWTAPESQRFQEDDLLIRYAHFNTSPAANFIYKSLALTGYDLIWGKVNAVLFFALTTLFIFITGRAMYSRVGGWASAIIFMLFPSIFKQFSGGFMSALSAPILVLAVLVVFRRKWWWSMGVMAAGSLVYPMVAIQSGMVFLVDFVLNDTNKIFMARMLRIKYVPLLLAAVLSMLIISDKYIAPQHEFGKLVTRSEIKERVEFTKQGRYPLIPVPPLWKQLEKRWFNPFHVLLFLAAYFFLAKRALRLPRGLYALLLSGIVLYWLADIFLMRLYIPDRYILRAFPIFMALTGGYWCARVVEAEYHKRIVIRLPRFTLRLPYIILIGGLLTGIGFYEFHGDLRPGRKTVQYNKHSLYSSIRSLPGRPMIAVHPYLGSEIPFMTGKSVLISRELSHPWWTDYWEIVSERTRDFFRAYYTMKPEELKGFISKYNIDYWVVEPRHFSRRYLRRRKKFYMEPFGRWMRKELILTNGALLNRVPESFRLFDNGRYYIVSSEKLVDWLDTRVKPPRTGTK